MRWLRLALVRAELGHRIRDDLLLTFNLSLAGQILGADEHEASRRMKSEIFTQVSPCTHNDLKSSSVLVSHCGHRVFLSRLMCLAIGRDLSR